MSVGCIYEPIDFLVPGLVTAKMARQLVSGTQIGWFSLGNMLGVFDQLSSTNHQPQFKFLQRVIATRALANEYLTFGRLMRPIYVDSPSVIGTSSSFTFLQASAWMPLNSTNLGIVGANASPYISLKLAIDIDPQAYELGSPPYALWQTLNNAKRQQIGVFNDAISYSIILPPLSTLLLEIL